MKDYKKILEGVVNIINNTEKSDIGFNNICAYIGENCPELKESGDERIRKAIITLLNTTIKGKKLYSITDTTRSEMLAWLEKQGEQKPADKVEPKFKVGDWVVYNYANTISPVSIITRINGQIIDLIDTRGMQFQTEMSELNQNYHLWTIQDAKDGNVLAFNDDTIVIFKDLYNSSTFHSYCHIEDGIFTASEKDVPDWWEGKGFYPATKEQRDFLFQKMKEAGYEWDAEEKELKKIEHFCELDNSYTCVKFPFKAKVKSSGTIVTIHDGQLSLGGEEWIKYQSDAEDGYKLYKPNDLELVCNIKQNLTWSEEDEKRAESLLGWLDTLVNYIHHDAIVSLDLRRERMQQVEQLKTWLKSLKDRVQLQPKQEWSEEDEYNFAFIQEALLGLDGDDSYREKCCKMADWLESLKDKYTWKPSDEQLRELRCVISGCSYDIEPLVELETKLKEL